MDREQHRVQKLNRIEGRLLLQGQGGKK